MIETKIVGSDKLSSVISEAEVVSFETGSGKHSGLTVLTHEFLDTTSTAFFFFNPNFGIAMNQAIAFGGPGMRATVLHAGVNSGNAISGTTDVSPTTNKLIDATGGFDALVGPGALVHNTTVDEYALVTEVDSDTQLSLDADIMDAGSETFVINDIWIGTAVQGSWNFSDSDKFTITNALNNDEATFTVDSSHIWNASNFVSFTGKVDLDTYDTNQNSIILEFGLDGILVGNSVELDVYIDTNNFSEQNFIISKEDFGLVSNDFNSMRIMISRNGGAKPSIKFDDFQWENEGEGIKFSVGPPKGRIFHINEFCISLADNIPGTVVDGTMTGISYDKILGKSALTNGFVFQFERGGIVTGSASVRTLSTLFTAGFELTTSISDGTNTFIILKQSLGRVSLFGDSNDKVSIIINDSMDDLLHFTVTGKGRVELV